MTKDISNHPERMISISRLRDILALLENIEDVRSDEELYALCGNNTEFIYKAGQAYIKGAVTGIIESIESEHN